MTSQPPATGSGRDGAARCADCGTRAAPGQFFCDSCGAVLRWARHTARGETAQDAHARESDAPRTEEPASGQFATRTGNARGTDDAHTAEARPAAGRSASRAEGDRAAEGGVGRDTGPDDRDGSRSVDLGASATGSTEPSPGSGRATGQYADAEDNAYADVVASFGEAPSTATRTSETDGTPSGTRTSGEPGPDPDRPSPGRPDTSASSTEDPGTSASRRSEPLTPNPHTTGATDEPTRTGGAEAAPTAPRPSASSATPAAGDDTVARARSLIVPVADSDRRDAPTASIPPVLPGRPVADRPQVRNPGREPGADGGVPCPWCGTSNRPDRHYCVLCAMPQSGGPAVPGRRPWWRRVLDFRQREAPWAGDRPRLKRGLGYLMTWALWAVLLTVLITAVVNADDAVSAVRDHFSKRGPVGPDSVKASRSYPRHGPELAFDKLNNTWWGPGVNQSGEGEWVEARFDQPTRLLDVIITPGVSVRADELSESALPRRVEAVITTAGGKKESRFLTLDQAAGGQRRAFRADEVTAVRLIVRSAYAASADKQVAIAEIEFFGPSNSGRSR
ncbi:zinc ribbon domain-containing protein [Streptomyces cyaneochromogenes]|uniref:Zinc ribbon domain-containing protein n=1 Tax=Streptomyces cyaneochromogenes TaxID=2496836 RepID=A0A3S9MH60_9ACTN|nr:zinc ribbon domain-containing protein [Streptomyces cyaneochromogenes]AZQ38536.1 zinc ribbon domain-containing protein [Streptomyces cyaneochromogenes]